VAVEQQRRADGNMGWYGDAEIGDGGHVRGFEVEFEIRLPRNH
jgi:hypothetical protein